MTTLRVAESPADLETWARVTSTALKSDNSKVITYQGPLP